MIDLQELASIALQLENEMWIRRKQSSESKTYANVPIAHSPNDNLRPDEILRNKIWDEYYNKDKPKQEEGSASEK